MDQPSDPISQMTILSHKEMQVLTVGSKSTWELLCVNILKRSEGIWVSPDSIWPSPIYENSLEGSHTTSIAFLKRRECICQLLVCFFPTPFIVLFELIIFTLT